MYFLCVVMKIKENVFVVFISMIVRTSYADGNVPVLGRATQDGRTGYKLETRKSVFSLFLDLFISNYRSRVPADPPFSIPFPISHFLP